MPGVAGAGLTLSAGVLSIDGAVVNGVGDAAATLVEGFNHGTADLTADRKWTLPASPVAGDIVHVKAPLLAGNVICCVMATAINNLSEKRQYPLYY